MALHDPKRRGFLLAYDISDDRSRACIQRRVKKFSGTYQKSVYEVELSPAEVNQLLDFIGRYFDEVSDSLLLLPLNPSGYAYHTGNAQVFPTQTIMVIS
ncbi:MAG: hypothetical protein AWU56_352 [Idiomarina sp. T82-3]|uniref:CRISPR-associated endonuclease Cas2 n=1 Tax=Idiomarina TaxID=135575 RepID=UPI00079AB280|nr:CRISPR-associated endonuclease Cas2 [Idiomarina sp. T82-3]KXS36237.1 MAG: hypothetical protein AWU56_352 [Idiomarina sp. T82-3]